MRPVRVRIGPSPTGEPHVGTGYIALFNRAFARQQGGKFVLRVEDTDQTRSKPEWERQIMAGLTWLGLDWDEGPDVGGPFGPYRQSERTEIYQRHVQQLVEAGHAYRCFTTDEELAELRAKQLANKQTPRYDGRHRDLPAKTVKEWMNAGKPFVVRMKVPQPGSTTVKDALRDPIVFDHEQVDDQVLQKSDGFPTYHLANVVDDHLMEITHVIRAEEWISSTPKHLLLYEMFGWEPPTFIHMPLLLNKDGSKISKRKSPVSILDYQQRGYLPEAVLNYLALLGMTMPDEREVFTVDEFADALAWDRVNVKGARFDVEKLTWLNGKYLREVVDDEAFVTALRDHVFSEDRLRALVPLFKERIDKFEDFVPNSAYFFSGEIEPDPDLMKPKKQTFKDTADVLEKLVEHIETQVDFRPEALEEATRVFAEDVEWKTKDLFMPIRIALTGRKASPSLFDVMSVLGRALVRRRLRYAVVVLKQAAQAEQRAAQKAKKEEKKKGT